MLLAADADEFVTVAKFRAMRRLWARIEQACGLDPKPLRLHAETAWRMMTKRDPFVNILRTGDGGGVRRHGRAPTASRCCPTRRRSACRTPSRGALARNSQIVLIEESHLARVSDPAAGAGGFEALTAELAEAGWAAFQAIEARGRHRRLAQRRASCSGGSS